jgi:ubiquinone/menaquinone biosynthesis C-methylase UbiE/uncharacterized protein YbaR (Trm112 family)
MKFRVLDLLRDVDDGSQLAARNVKVKPVKFDRQLPGVMCKDYCGVKNRPVVEAGVTVHDCAHCYGQEVVEGELVSTSGRTYPIVAGIPRLLSNATAGWIKKNQATFSLEWKMFRFGERNWGQDIEFRKQLFLKGMGVPRDELRDKLIFDAGCGSGALSIEFANAFGMEVLALDLAFGIEQAYAHNTNPFVYFIQGSVMEPPVKPAAADFVYCAGVLVAVPDAKAGFTGLTPILKHGGRYFTWWYHPIDRRHHPNDKLKMTLYNWLRVNVVSSLPIRVQHGLFLAAMPLYLVKRTFDNLFKGAKDRPTWREKMQDLTDMFSPVYQHRYSEEEIVQWYEEIGLRNACVAYQEDYGFAVRGDNARAPEARPSPSSWSKAPVQVA